MPIHHGELQSEHKTGPLLAAIQSREQLSNGSSDAFEEVCSPTVIHGKKPSLTPSGREIEDELRMYSLTASNPAAEKSSFYLKKTVHDMLNNSGNTLLNSRK